MEQIVELEDNGDEELKAHFEYTTVQILKRADADRSDSLASAPLLRKCIAEVVYEYCGKLALDLEAFSKHGKRSTINTDDVKLVVRNNEKLSKILTESIERLKSVKGTGKAAAKKKS